MGERAAYRVSNNNRAMLMLRKQWYLGSSHDELKEFITNVAKMLMVERFVSRGDPKINSGCVALRKDLGIGRLTMAMIAAISDPPFNEVVENNELNCDINDHGIYEIELVEWNKWNLNQYDVDYKNGKDTLGEKKTSRNSNIHRRKNT